MNNNLGYWCRDAVLRYPERIAIVDLSSDEPVEVRYDALDRRMDRVASMLRSRGLSPGDRVALAISNRFEFVEVMYGAMRAGVVPVPLNTKLGADTLRFILRDASVVGAFCEPSSNRFITGVLEELSVEPVLVVGERGDAPSDWLDYEEALAAHAEEMFEPPALADDHPSFQPYTSGSTGKPKGVVLTHAGQLWWVRCLKKYWPEKSDARALAAVPLYHKNAMAGAIKPLLQSGGTVVLLPDFEPRRFLRTLSRVSMHAGGRRPRRVRQVASGDGLDRQLGFLLSAIAEFGLRAGSA